MLVTKYKLIFFFLLIFASSVSAEILQNKQLDYLFNKLSKTKDIYNAAIIEKKIWSIWHKHPNNLSLTNKLELGTKLMYQGDYIYALQIFNNIIKTDPYWSEVWNKRATLLFLMQEYKKSLNDIDEVLSLEPRHFGALSGKAQIYIKLQKYQKAINALKKAKKIYPIINSYKLVPSLKKLLKGQET